MTIVFSPLNVFVLILFKLCNFIFKGFFKQLSIEEKKQRLGGLHPIAIILYLIMNFVLFRANWKITTKDMVTN